MPRVYPACLFHKTLQHSTTCYRNGSGCIPRALARILRQVPSWRGRPSLRREPSRGSQTSQIFASLSSWKDQIPSSLFAGFAAWLVGRKSRHLRSEFCPEDDQARRKLCRPPGIPNHPHRRRTISSPPTAIDVEAQPERRGLTSIQISRSSTDVAIPRAAVVEHTIPRADITMHGARGLEAKSWI